MGTAVVFPKIPPVGRAYGADGHMGRGARRPVLCMAKRYLPSMETKKSTKQSRTVASRSAGGCPGRVQAGRATRRGAACPSR